jgi:hypothetical protein
VGAAALGLFFAVLFLAGGVGMGNILVTWVIPEWRLNHAYVQTSGRVVAARIGAHATDPTRFRAEITVEYTVGGRRYRVQATDPVHGGYTSQRSLVALRVGRFRAGQSCTVWYDPRQPRRAALARGYTWSAWLMLLVPVPFLATGGLGLAYIVSGWNKSAERRAALAQRVAQLDPSRASQSSLPFVPGEPDLTSSPGTTLAYRLAAQTPAWSLLGFLLACLFWNGILSVLLTVVVRSHAAGNPEWFLTAFTIPLGLVGVLLVWGFFRHLREVTRVAPTIVEISRHPLRPAEECELYVAQPGPLDLERFGVWLVCEEEATYSQGTASRTMQRRVYQEELFHREGVRIPAGTLFETRCKLRMPPRAMHSFQSSHNQIRWKILIEAATPRWPHFERGFTLHVHPVVNGERRA